MENTLQETGKKIYFKPLKANPISRETWRKYPLGARLAVLVNLLKWEPDVFPEQFQYVGRQKQGATICMNVRMAPFFNKEKADKSVGEWLFQGDETLPRVKLRVLVRQMMSNAISLTPCYVTYTGKNVGVALTLTQFFSLTTLIHLLLLAKKLKTEDFTWLSGHLGTDKITGITVMHENSEQVAATIWKKISEINKDVKFESEMPELVARVRPDLELLFQTEVPLVILPEGFLQQSMALVKDTIPTEVAEAIKNSGLPEGSMLDWIEHIARVADRMGKVWVRNEDFESETQVSLPEAPQEPTEISASDDAEVEAPAPIPETPKTAARNKSERLRREQQLDLLPDLLDGLDAYEALRLVEEQGAFERTFYGEPAVIDRLVDEAGEDKERRVRTEEKSVLIVPRSLNSSIKAVVHITQGNLMFANKQVFNLVQTRRYNGRAEMKRRGMPMERNLPDIQILAPHEFGQVPGFVAGQHRYPKDRLCAVMISFDPVLWGYNLRDRKALIGESEEDCIWVFPKDWLENLPEGYNWWDQGLLGSPQDPTIQKFIKPSEQS